MRTLSIIVIAAIMACVGTQMSTAQRVDYYRVTKVVKADGTIESYGSDNVGQFVKRENGVCYDCGSSGANAGNGILNLYETKGSRTAYNGHSFWGDNCTYVFDDSKGILNIKNQYGETLVLRREQAPAGRSYPSFLLDPGFLDGTYARMWNEMSAQRDAALNNNTTTTVTKTVNGKTISSRANICPSCLGNKRCSLCNGKGYYQPSPSNAHKADCDKCHRTGTCSLCGGKGTYGSTHWLR